MLYDELVDILFDYMNNGITISLKSLLNSIMNCEDVNSIGMYHDRDFFISNKYETEDTDKNTKYKHNYMSGYIEDKFDRYMYNNVGIRIYNKNQIELGSLWFGEEHMLSTEKNKDRYGNEIEDYQVHWKTDIVYLILLNSIAVDRNVIFGNDTALY